MPNSNFHDSSHFLRIGVLTSTVSNDQASRGMPQLAQPRTGSALAAFHVQDPWNEFLDGPIPVK